jgi:penicillin amidase
VQTGPEPSNDRSQAIFRDPFGIPHLWGDTVDDLAYVQGWQAAYDLAWQLEYGRLRAEGRTAVLLGADAVEWDVFARRARITDTARRAFDRLDGRTRAWCTAYVEGVNDALPLGAAGSAEFAALDALPGRWPAWAPLAVFAGIHVLFGTGQYKLWRAHIAATLGPELVGLLGSAAARAPAMRTR